MRRLIVRIFAVIGFIFTVLVAAIFALLVWVKPPAVPVPDTTVLSLSLDRALADAPAGDGLSGYLSEAQPSLRDVLDTLERGGGDARVKGLFVRLGGDDIGAAQVQELRDAIAAFRAKGKFAIAYADSFGEFGPGNHAYYLVSDGGTMSYRTRIRTPSFAHVQMVPLLSRGLTISDLVTILGSVDYVLADIDR